MKSGMFMAACVVALSVFAAQAQEGARSTWESGRTAGECDPSDGQRLLAVRGGGAVVAAGLGCRRAAAVSAVWALPGVHRT